MKRYPYFAAVFACLSMTSCTMNKLDDAHTTVELGAELPGVPLTISIERGPHWTNEMQAGPLKFNILPQIVIWAEHNDGTLIDTLYVTGALGKMNHGGKRSKGAQFWRECFPAWSQRILDAGQKLPTPQAPYTDAVTSATPQSSFTLHTKLPAALSDYKIYAEVNKSADFNRRFTKKEKGGWVGQPSLVYAVSIPATKSDKSFRLEAIGYGDPNAKRQINTDLSGFDTALEIVSDINIAF